MINKLTPGDTQISASGWNEIREFINSYERQQHSNDTVKRNPFLVTVKNTTDSALPALSVVKLTTPIYSRSGDTFINKGVEFGIEMNATVPDSETNVIAITQAACPADGMVKAIVCGATPVMIIGDSSSGCNYAKVVSGVTGYLELTNDPTSIRVIGVSQGSYTSSAPGGAYVAIDYIDDRERFLINCTPSNGYASIAKKGAAFKVSRGSNGWEVQTNNNSAINYVIAICQEDIPDGYTGNFYMPFYTPEQNCGVTPTVAVNSGITSPDFEIGHRGIGAASGSRVGFEHEFSNKRLDYMYSHGQYTYCPKFTYTGAAVSYNGGVGIVIEGHTYGVIFPPLASSYSSAMMAPDVYSGDQITVLVEESVNANYSATVTAIEYPTDFAKGSSIVVEGTMLLGRGWDEDYITGTDFKYAIKVQGAALI